MTGEQEGQGGGGSGKTSVGHCKDFFDFYCWMKWGKSLRGCEQKSDLL